MAKPSLELAVEVTAADGTQHRWGPGSKAGDIPTGLSFRTKQSEGFADANLSLARRIDRDYVDLHLLDSVVITGADGGIAYEGRVNALPRSMQQSHTVAVQTAGWMAHTRDRKLQEIYVDRDLSAWTAPSSLRRADLLTGNYTTSDPSTVTDDAGVAAVRLQHTDQWASPARPLVEAWYDAGPIARVGSVYYDMANVGQASTGDANWDLLVRTTNDDRATSIITNTGDIWVLVNFASTTTPTSARYAFISWFYNSTPGGSAGYDYSLNARNLAVFGDQGIPLIGTTDPKGVAASDVIKHAIGKYCPMLNTSGVQTTTYPIGHLAFKDRTDPYDVLLEVNKYHLWQLAVYENRTLQYGPVDMTDYDWEVRLSDPGVTFDAQGDSAQTLANGVAVEYQNPATGKPDVLIPDAHQELRDSDPENPYNLHGYPGEHSLALSSPTKAEDALQAGRAALAEFNQPKAPGTISVQGHIRDRAGHWQPSWRVRAGDRIIIVDHANDRPRLVVETDYSHDSHTVSMAVDQTFNRLDAVLDRLGTAIRAAGLGG